MCKCKKGSCRSCYIDKKELLTSNTLSPCDSILNHPCPSDSPCKRKKACSCSVQNPKTPKATSSHGHCKKSSKKSSSHVASSSHAPSCKKTAKRSSAQPSCCGSNLRAASSVSSTQPSSSKTAHENTHSDTKPSTASKSKKSPSGKAASSKPSSNSSWFESPEQDSIRKDFLKAINRERKAHNIAPVTLHKTLNKSASKHTYDQGFVTKAMTHVGSDGSRVRERVRRDGYKAIWFGENVAYGQKTPEWAVQSLMKSPGHRKNILNERAKEMGIHGGVGKDGHWYWTQILSSGPK